MYKRFVKRFLDVIFALLVLILSSPLSIITFIVLCITNKGRPFFFQKRPGKGEQIFEIVKFKSMTDKKKTNEELLPDYQRITKFGKFIRKSSIDEIPQLWNVLKGDMSIIGPRPLLTTYLPLYTKEQKKRHAVRPGITGWAQINGRNAISWEQKFEYDVWYVENFSASLDLKILFVTILKVLRSSDISASSEVTMETFTGSNTKEP